MKPYTYALLAAIAACGLANAETAYTTPVGYVTVDVPVAADTTIAPSLSQSPLLQAASTGISGNVISVAATGAADDAFINTGGDPNSKTYVLVRSGALAGLRYPVTGNTATTITVNGGATTLQAQGFVGTRTLPLVGDLISVVPYWTLNTLFPLGAGVGQSSPNIFSPDSYVLFSDQENVGENRGSSALYFYWAGGVPDDLPGDPFPAGWYQDGDIFSGLRGTVALDPAVSMIIRSKATGSPSTVTITGTVPDVPLATTILTATLANDEYLGCPYPVDTTLAQSGLQSVIAAATNILDPTELVFVYADGDAGNNKGASAQYLYWAGGIDAGLDMEFAAGWYLNGDVFSGAVTDKVLKAGRCFTIRKAAAGSASSTVWTAPLPYTL